MDEELDLIEMETESGETVQLCVERYFFYDGEEYVLLSDDIGKNDGHEISRFIMKVEECTDEDGEEMEEFVPIEDDALMARLIQLMESPVTDSEDDE